LLLGGAGGGLALLGALALFLFNGGPDDRRPRPKKKDHARSPLDRLDPDQVPPLDRIAGLPAGKVRLVAVLGEHRARSRNSRGFIWSLALSPDGKTLAAGTNRGELLLVDPETLRERHRFETGQTFGFSALAFSPDGKLLASGGDRIQLWDVKRKKELRELKGPGVGMHVSGVAFVNGGRELLSTGHPGRLWDVKTGQERKGFFPENVQMGSIFAVAPNARQFVCIDPQVFKAGKFSYTMTLWDLKTGEPIRKFKGHHNTIQSVAYMPNGKLVLSLSWTGGLRRWSPATGKEVRPRKQMKASNLLVAISRDGRYALSASGGPRDGMLRLWEVKMWKELRHWHTTGWVGMLRAVFLANARQVVFTEGNTLRLLDVKTWKELHPPRGHTQGVTAIAFARDGRQLLSAGADGRLRLWDLKTGRDLGRFSDPVSAKRLALSPGGRYALTLPLKPAGVGSRGEPVAAEPPQLWDVAGGRELTPLKGPGGMMVDAVFPSGDNQILTLGADGTVRRWDVKSGKGKALGRCRNLLLPGVLSADGSKVIGAGQGGLLLWDVKRRQVLRKWTITPEVVSLAPSRRGRRVCFGGNDGTVGVCRQGRQTRPNTFPKGHHSPVRLLALSPRGKLLASADEKGHVVLWDTAAGRKWAQWTPPSKIRGLAFAPDGRHLATANDNGTVYVYRITKPATR
jgi:WD40 repeat protein